MAFKTQHTIHHNDLAIPPGQVVTMDELSGVDVARLVQVGALLPLGLNPDVGAERPSVDDLMEHIEQLHGVATEQQGAIDRKDRAIEKLNAEVENLRGQVNSSAQRETAAREEAHLAEQRWQSQQKALGEDRERLQNALNGSEANLKARDEEIARLTAANADLQGQLAEANKAQQRKK